jgi:hypothetical protein
MLKRLLVCGSIAGLAIAVAGCGKSDDDSATSQPAKTNATAPVPSNGPSNGVQSAPVQPGGLSSGAQASGFKKGNAAKAGPPITSAPTSAAQGADSRVGSHAKGGN